MCARGGGDSRGGEMKATEDDADDDHVSEWEKGLPTNEELMPLSQSLISPALASAFSIRHEPAKTPLDVQRGARATLQNLRNQKASIPSFGSYPSFQAPDKLRGEGWVGVGDVPPFSGNGVVGSGDEAARVIAGGVNQRGPLVCHPSGPYPPPGTVFVAPESYGGGIDETSFNPVDGGSDQGSLPYMMPCAVAGGTSYERRPENSYGATRGDDSSKGGGGLLSKNVFKRADSEPEDGDSAGCPENSSEEPNARTLKRPRLVWTPQLHKRFVDAVGHLGIKNAVPKTIMQLMNVEGLTRENVASHLQKYRLYLKRVQGLSSEGPSASDQLFASTPLPPNLGGLHYVHNHRDDVGAPPFASSNVPMPYTAVAPCPMGPGHYSGYEHHPYSGVGRGMPQQSPQSDDQREQQITANENHHNHSHNYNNQTHNQPSSPPQHILTLFPTSSR